MQIDVAYVVVGLMVNITEHNRTPQYNTEHYNTNTIIKSATM